MNRQIINIVILLMVGSVAASPFAEKKVDIAIKGYVLALNSDNIGLQNDAMHKIAILKSQYPELNLSICEKKLQKIVAKDIDIVVRLRAQLTLAFLQDDNLATKVKVVPKEDSQSFFDRLYQEVNSHLFASY